MRIVVAGSSGLVGSALIPHLQAQGHLVQRLMRGKSGREKDPLALWWNPEEGELDSSILEGVDVVINLSGDHIFNARWSESKKEKIRTSRLQTTALLAKTFAQLKRPPKFFLNASAVGIYGSRGDAFLSEESTPGRGFLASVVKDWEKATEPAVEAGIRVVCLRIGMVLSSEGGALKKMLPPFKWGLGGVLGSGNQYVSWIAIDDLVRIVEFLVEHPEISGPVNATAPNPISNAEFTKVLGYVLKKPTVFPVPELILTLILGERAKDLLLSSVRAEPVVLVGAGFRFLYPQIKEALDHLCKRR
jgi:uncharacterized protein (TIGR01777 family)